MNIMEQHIWDYLDGACSEQEGRKIEQLIETDPSYRIAYADLKILHEDLGQLGLDEPSMGFTRNVMDQVKPLPVPGSIRSQVDKRIIYGIAGFFLVSIVFMLVTVIRQIDWSQPANIALPELRVPSVNYGSWMNSVYLRMFFFVDLVLALYVLDSVLRKKLLSK